MHVKGIGCHPNNKSMGPPRFFCPFVVPFLSAGVFFLGAGVVSLDALQVALPHLQGSSLLPLRMVASSPRLVNL